MKFAALAVALSSLSLLPAIPAVAQGTPLKIDNCEDYVARATSQVQMATGCNVSGIRWSPDVTVQKTWCEGASARDRGREDEERREALVICRGDFGAVPIKNCNEYVARSRTQVELAQSLSSSCTFEGMRWSEIVVQHVNWCNRNPAARHEAEDAARRKELAACQVKSK